MKTSTDPISIRDHLAAAALQGLLANKGEDVERFYYGHKDTNIAFRLASFSYDIADAMLLVRGYNRESQP